MIEGREADRGDAWHLAITRFGANQMEARQEGKLIWDCPAVQKWDAKEAYFSQFGPVHSVFQAVEEP